MDRGHDQRWRLVSGRAAKALGLRRTATWNGQQVVLLDGPSRAGTSTLRHLPCKSCAGGYTRRKEYAWLNRILAVGVYTRTPTGVDGDVFEVL